MKTRQIIQTVITCMLFLAISIHAQGQLTRSTIGIKGGMNVSRLTVEGLSNEENLLGYHFGVFGRIGLTRSFGIQPEVLFASKGSVLNYNNAFVTGGAVVSLRYVDVPLLAVVNLSRNLSIHFGPYASYLADISVKNKSDSEGSDFESEINKDNFRKVDYGIAAGAGIEFGALNGGVRYIHGLSKVGEDSEMFGQPYNFPQGKNSTFQVYVGLNLF